MQQSEETTAQIERRLLRWMIILGAASTTAVAIAMPGKFAGGFVAGEAIAIVGYIWLLDAMAAALNAEKARITKRLALKLVLRYPILLGALYLFYRTKWLPIGAVVAGLFIPLAGGVAESLYQVARMMHPHRPSALR
ncbi:MAG TPA: hypothetical protein VKV79_01295 [Terriglobia bacterium]|nr:hypothetical protein [Terriglobia bacterium]